MQLSTCRPEQGIVAVEAAEGVGLGPWLLLLLLAMVQEQAIYSVIGWSKCQANRCSTSSSLDLLYQ